MKIAVYCGSNLGNNKAFEQGARELGAWIGKNHHTLVYGAGKRGLMGVVADAVLENGGEVIGVIPQIEEIQQRKHLGLSRCIEVDTLSKRKEVMIELSDAFIALPGGPGTMDEISDVISLSRLNELKGACILYDIDGYYQPLKQFYDEMETCGFVQANEMQHILYSANLEEITQFMIENYKD